MISVLYIISETDELGLEFELQYTLKSPEYLDIIIFPFYLI